MAGNVAGRPLLRGCGRCPARSGGRSEPSGPASVLPKVLGIPRRSEAPGRAPSGGPEPLPPASATAGSGARRPQEAPRGGERPLAWLPPPAVLSQSSREAVVPDGDRDVLVALSVNAPSLGAPDCPLERASLPGCPPHPRCRLPRCWATAGKRVADEGPSGAGALGLEGKTGWRGWGTRAPTSRCGRKHPAWPSQRNKTKHKQKSLPHPALAEAQGRQDLRKGGQAGFRKLLRP